MFILQSVARGRVSVNIIFEYQILGSGEERLCPNCITGTPRARACIGVSDGWPNNHINLEAWYQTRGIRMCSRRMWGRRIVSQCSLTFILSTLYAVNSMRTMIHHICNLLTYVQRYPCGISWGLRRTWGAFSRTWNLPSRQLSSLYSTCGGMRDPTCPLPTTPPPPPPTTTPPPTNSQPLTTSPPKSPPSDPSSPSPLITIIEAPPSLPDDGGVGSGQNIAASGQVGLENP